MIPLWSKQILATLGVALALVVITVFNNTVLRTDTSAKNGDTISIQTSATPNNYRDSSGSHLFSKERVTIQETEPVAFPTIEPAPETVVINTTTNNTPPVTETPTQQSLHIYANILAPKLIDLYTKTKEHIATFQSLATNTPSSTVYEKALFLATLYENAAISVGTQNTPTMLSAEQVALQKNYHVIAASLRTLAEKALQGTTDVTVLQNYNAAVLASAQAIVSIATILKREKVLLTSSESGYFFLDLIP